MNSHKSPFFPLRPVLSGTMANRRGDAPIPSRVNTTFFEVWIPEKRLPAAAAAQICLLMYRGFRTDTRSPDFGSP